jgi:hypothetical protein
MVRPSSFDFNYGHIFVEGKHFKDFLENWTKKNNPALSHCVKFQDFKSQDASLRELLKALVDASEFADPQKKLRFGILADAEESGDAELQKYTTIIRACSVEVADPIVQSNLQTHVTPNGVEIVYAVLLIPKPNECKQTGALEQSLLLSVAGEFNELKLAAQNFADHYAVSVRNPKITESAKSQWRDKVIVHSMLAASERPDSPLWREETFRYWDQDSGELCRITSFLQLFCSDI